MLGVKLTLASQRWNCKLATHVAGNTRTKKNKTKQKTLWEAAGEKKKEAQVSPIKVGGHSRGEKHTGGDPKGMTRSVSDIKITHFPVTSLNYFEYLDRRYTVGSKNLLVLTCLRLVNLHLKHINPLSADRLLGLTLVVTLRCKQLALNGHNSSAMHSAVDAPIFLLH